MADEESNEDTLVAFPAGPLYVDLHNNYMQSDQYGKTYRERLRNTFEDFVHQFNKEVERDQEQLMAEATPDSPG